jgi:DNA repair exonuclease SbcCD nuclease subunit
MAKKEYKIGIITDVHIMERNPRCRSDRFLETTLAKLEYVAKNNDFVIIAGDLFHVHNNSSLLFNTVFTLFNKYKDKWHGILGNHDTFSRNTNALNRCTIGSLYYTNVMQLHFEPWELCGLTFVPVLVDTKVKDIPVDVDNTNILIAHKFFENGFAPEESLTKDDIRRLGYKMAFLGHDHSPYDEEFIGSTTLIRMGSLTRIDTQRYNKDREIVYYQIRTIGDGEFEYSREIIPHKPSQEVYIDEAYQHMCATGVKKKEVSFIQIGDVLSKLTRRAGGVISLDKTLRKLGTPEDSISDIKWKHEINNVQYN